MVTVSPILLAIGLSLAGAVALLVVYAYQRSYAARAARQRVVPLRVALDTSPDARRPDSSAAVFVTSSAALTAPPPGCSRP